MKQLEKYGSRKFIVTVATAIVIILNGRFNILSEVELEILFAVITVYVGAEWSIDMLNISKKKK